MNICEPWGDCDALEREWNGLDSSLLVCEGLHRDKHLDLITFPAVLDNRVQLIHLLGRTAKSWCSAYKSSAKLKISDRFLIWLVCSQTQQYLEDNTQRGWASPLRTASASFAVVMTCIRAWSPGPSTPGTSETSGESELLQADAVLQPGTAETPATARQGPSLNVLLACSTWMLWVAHDANWGSCRRGSTGCAASEIANKRLTGASPKPWRYQSLNPWLHWWKGRQSPRLWHWEMENAVMVKAGSWWLLAPGGWLQPHLHICISRRESALQQQRRGWVSRRPQSCQHKMVKFRILRKKSKARNRMTALDFRGADFGMFKNLLWRIPWDAVIERSPVLKDPSPSSFRLVLLHI